MSRDPVIQVEVIESKRSSKRTTRLAEMPKEKKKATAKSKPSHHQQKTTRTVESIQEERKKNKDIFCQILIDLIIQTVHDLQTTNSDSGSPPVMPNSDSVARLNYLNSTLKDITKKTDQTTVDSGLGMQSTMNTTTKLSSYDSSGFSSLKTNDSILNNKPKKIIKIVKKRPLPPIIKTPTSALPNIVIDTTAQSPVSSEKNKSRFVKVKNSSTRSPHATPAPPPPKHKIADYKATTTAAKKSKAEKRKAAIIRPTPTPNMDISRLAFESRQKTSQQRQPKVKPTKSTKRVEKPESPTKSASPVVKYLGVVRTDPAEYVAKYGHQFIQSNRR